MAKRGWPLATERDRSRHCAAPVVAGWQRPVNYTTAEAFAEEVTRPLPNPCLVRLSANEAHASSIGAAPTILSRRGSMGGRMPRMFLGENLLAYLVLALGAALAVGNLLALVRPPEQRRADTDLDRPPLARTVIMIVVGALAAVWALASLVAG